MMTEITTGRAVTTGIAAVTMMLLNVAPGQAAWIRWGAFVVGASAVASLVLNYRSLWNRFHSR